MAKSLKVNINGKKIDFPTCYEELSFNQLEQLFKNINADLNKVLNILTGEDMSNAKVSQVEPLLPFIQYLADEPEVKKQYYINEKEVEIPDNLDVKTWGQKLMYQKNYEAYVKKEIDFETYSTTGAKIYLQYEMDGVFSEQKVNELELDLSPIDVVLINDFFLNCFLQSLKENQRYYDPQTAPKKSKQGLKGLKSTGVGERFTTWLKKMF